MNTLSYTIQKENQGIVVVLDGDILGDVDFTKDIIAELEGYLKEGILHCTIDLSTVSFMNSSGLGLLVTILTKFRNKGGEVKLKGVSESVKKLLIITKLNSIFGE